MPSKNVTYSCCICGQRYINWDDAEKCEKSHMIPEKVDKPGYSKDDRKSGYPLSVLIHFKGGKSARYYRK